MMSMQLWMGLNRLLLLELVEEHISFVDPNGQCLIQHFELCKGGGCVNKLLITFYVFNLGFFYLFLARTIFHRTH